jgi:phospholipase/carboxylesterase
MNSFQPLHFCYCPATGPATHTLLLLHGNGGSEHDLLPLVRPFGAHFNVLSLRGNAGEDGYHRFFRRRGLGLVDEADVVFRAHELVHFVRGLSTELGFDARQLVVVGYSHGANMAGALLLRYPDLLAGALLWRAWQPLAEQGPAFHSSRRQPVLLIAGRRDLSIKPTASRRYAAVLAGLGFAVRLGIFDAGHRLGPVDLQEGVKWFRQHFPFREVAPPQMGTAYPILRNLNCGGKVAAG